MNSIDNKVCPLSEDFFYWPPEQIGEYKNWCEVGNHQHKRRINLVVNGQKTNKSKK